MHSRSTSAFACTEGGWLGDDEPLPPTKHRGLPRLFAYAQVADHHDWVGDLTFMGTVRGDRLTLCRASQAARQGTREPSRCASASRCRAAKGRCIERAVCSAMNLHYSFEGVAFGERLVATFVLDPVPFHDTDVGPMGEEPGQPRDGNRLGRIVAGPAPVAEAAVGHLMGQALHGPLPGGIQREGGSHQRGALEIGDDVGLWVPRTPSIQLRRRSGTRG
jgi:hypothetical protein